jgi:hypothetical protein
MHILFHGNCQHYSLMKILNIKTHTIEHIPCYETDISEYDMLYKITNADIIILQPISDTYRGKSHLSTKYILNHKRKETIAILFDSCYFNFYYPSLTYLYVNNTVVHEPCDYHDKQVIEAFKQNISPDTFIKEYVSNPMLYDKSYLDTLAEESLKELERRGVNARTKYCTDESIHYISIVSFIKENYKKQLLFWSVNHPTKYIFHHISKEILQITGLSDSINYDIDILSDDQRPILYKSIQQVVTFNVDEHIPKICNTTGARDIVKLYYDIYRTIDITSATYNK